jgi:hypothetical protein
VAPVNVVSIPRLELCAAILGTRLLKAVLDSMDRLGLEPELYAWTDSANVLHWLRGYPDKWMIFVANRIMEIQQLLPRHMWHHVPTEHKPADCVSRGICVTELKGNDLYWNAPWFMGKDLVFPPDPTDPILKELEEKPTTVVVAATTRSAMNFQEPWTSGGVVAKDVSHGETRSKWPRKQVPQEVRPPTTRSTARKEAIPPAGGSSTEATTQAEGTINNSLPEDENPSRITLEDPVPSGTKNSATRRRGSRRGLGVAKRAKALQKSLEEEAKATPVVEKLPKIGLVDLNNYSGIKRPIRVLARVIRMTKKMRKIPLKGGPASYPAAEDKQEALRVITRAYQEVLYPEEIETLTQEDHTKRVLHKSSNLFTLYPMVDPVDKILRVGVDWRLQRKFRNPQGTQLSFQKDVGLPCS